jgi:hypothetical protein
LRFGHVFADGDEVTGLVKTGLGSSNPPKGCCKWIVDQPAYFWINILAILGHLGNFIAMWIIYSEKNPLKITYTENVITWEQKAANTTCSEASRQLNTSNNGEFCIGPQTHTFDCGDELCYYDYGWMIIAFHMLSFAFQLGAALTDLCEGGCNFCGYRCFENGCCGIKCCDNGCCGYKYSKQVVEGKNPLRFIEYSISASIMLMVIAMINGIIDVHLLACIAVLTASCQLCGLVVEYLDDEKQLRLKWISHLNGWLTFCTAYWCIARAYFGSVEYSDASPPDFVVAIVAALFALYASFGLVQLVELMWMTPGCNRCCDIECCKTDSTICPALCPALRTADRKCNPRYKEIVFVTLSLGAKLTLGWILFFNILML